MPSLTVLVDGVVPPARIVIGCPSTVDGWGGWTVEKLKVETQRRLLDIYHLDQAVATITDEAGVVVGAGVSLRNCANACVTSSSDC